MKKIIIVVILLLAVSCTKKEFIISIEQPDNKLLDKLKLDIKVDNGKGKIVYLKSTNIVPTMETINMEISNEGMHSLKIKLKDTTFNFQINYPTEKYIILGPYLGKNDKINVGILKQEKGFTFH